MLSGYKCADNNIVTHVREVVTLDLVNFTDYEKCFVLYNQIPKKKYNKNDEDDMFRKKHKRPKQCVIPEEDIMIHEKVFYKNEYYHVCSYNDNTKMKLFVVNDDVFNDDIDPKKKYYMHTERIVHSNFISQSEAKGHHYVDELVSKNVEKKSPFDTIIHLVNDLSQDLRRENMQILNRNISNEFNNAKWTKHAPDGIDINDIPKNIIYNVKAKKFIIKVYHNGEEYRVDSTTSEEITNKGKIELAKWHLIQIAKDHPEILKYKDILKNYSDKQIRLMQEFNDIIKLSKIDNYEKSLIKIPKQKVVTANFDSLDDTDKKLINQYIENIGTGRRCTTAPTIIVDGIKYERPQYCCHVNARPRRGDAWKISGHPNQTTIFVTSCSAKISTEIKHQMMMNELARLNGEQMPYDDTKFPKQIKSRGATKKDTAKTVSKTKEHIERKISYQSDIEPDSVDKNESTIVKKSKVIEKNKINENADVKETPIRESKYYKTTKKSERKTNSRKNRSSGSKTNASQSLKQEVPVKTNPKKYKSGGSKTNVSIKSSTKKKSILLDK